MPPVRSAISPTVTRPSVRVSGFSLSRRFPCDTPSVSSSYASLLADAASSASVSSPLEFGGRPLQSPHGPSKVFRSGDGAPHVDRRPSPTVLSSPFFDLPPEGREGYLQRARHEGTAPVDPPIAHGVARRPTRRRENSGPSCPNSPQRTSFSFAAAPLRRARAAGATPPGQRLQASRSPQRDRNAWQAAGKTSSGQ